MMPGKHMCMFECGIVHADITIGCSVLPMSMRSMLPRVACNCCMFVLRMLHHMLSYDMYQVLIGPVNTWIHHNNNSSSNKDMHNNKEEDQDNP